jgi:endo-1,4-beta-xylanase
VRTSIRNWADPTGLGYQSTSRWGVGRLVAVAAQVPTSIGYAGSPRVKVGKPATFGVIVSAPEASCVGGLPLQFSFDRDPVTGSTGPAALGEATTNADGRAKLTVPTAGWLAGDYELTVSYAGNNVGCVGSSMSTEISVAAKGGPGP